MPIAGSDIGLYLSTTAGAAGDLNAGTPGASLGKYISTTTVDDDVEGELFTAATGQQNADSVVQYQCVFARNNHATLTLTGAKIYVESEVSGGATVAIAIDSTAKSDADQGPGVQALTIANDTTAPAGPLSFSTPTTEGAALTLGDLAPDEVKAVWVRRTLANTSAKNNDGFRLTVFGDTAE
jgi:hypothetical protein